MDFDPVSVAEIADMLGVERQKVASLKYHGKLPQPKKILKCGPLWDAKEIFILQEIHFYDHSLSRRQRLKTLLNQMNLLIPD